MHDILDFSNIVYLPEVAQYNFFILTFLMNENIIILSFFSYLLGDNKFLQSSNFLLFSIKSINPIQKHPHIIESYTHIL